MSPVATDTTSTVVGLEKNVSCVVRRVVRSCVVRVRARFFRSWLCSQTGLSLSVRAEQFRFTFKLHSQNARRRGETAQSIVSNAFVAAEMVSFVCSNVILYIALSFIPFIH
jgi:hypothetical protein